MNRKLVFIAMFFLFALWVHTLFADETGPLAKNILLSKAMDQALKGELEDAALISPLEHLFETSKDNHEKILSAYLLSFAPEKKLRWPQSLYLGICVSHLSELDSLGAVAKQRVLRLDADMAYEKGMFDRAIDEYNQIRTLGEGLQTEYATLKIGWCYLNLRQPSKAFHFWLDIVKAQLGKENGTTFFTLLQSLGQAFTENRERASTDVKALAQLRLDSNQRDAISEGVCDGMAMLNRTDVKALVKAVAELPWKDRIAEILLAKVSPSRKMACDYLSWVTLHSQVPPMKTELLDHTLSANLDALENQDSKYSLECEKELGDVLEKTLLSGRGRNYRLRYYRAKKDSLAFCQEGVKWLADHTTVEDRKDAPIEEIVSQCTTTFHSAQQATMQGFWRAFSEKNRTAIAAYVDQKADPLTRFVALTVKTNPGLRKCINDEALSHTKPYQRTLLPLLLAQRSLEESDLPGGFALLQAFAQKDVLKMVPTYREIWLKILARQIQAWLVHDDEFAKVYGTLIVYIPPETLRNYPEDTASTLWAEFLYRSKGRPEYLAVTAQMFPILIANNQWVEKKKMAEPLLDIAMERKMWQSAWGLFVEKHVSLTGEGEKRSTILFFDAIVSGKFTPAIATGSTDPNIQFLLNLSSSVKQKNPASICHEVTPSRSPLSPDVRFLKDFEKQIGQSLASARKSKDPVKAITQLVSFYHHSGKRLARRSWSHAQLANMGKLLLADFCKAARNDIDSTHAKQTSGSDWMNLITEVHKDLENCEKALKGSEGKA